jgi:hypothetical protein
MACRSCGKGCGIEWESAVAVFNTNRPQWKERLRACKGPGRSFDTQLHGDRVGLVGSVFCLCPQLNVSRATARLDNADTKLEVDLSPLSVLKPVDQLCHLWQRYTATAISPLAGPSVLIRREMGTSNSHTLVRLEGKVNSVIQKAVDRTSCLTSAIWVRVG